MFMIRLGEALAYSDQNILLIDAAGPGSFLADDLRQRAQPGVAHDLDVGERPRELLAHDRVLVLAELARLVRPRPELLV